MITYVKIMGPPLLKAIQALEKMAIETPQVCIMDSLIEYGIPQLYTPESTMEYFSPVAEIPEERCDNIISRSGQKLGKYDFYFEWFTEPSTTQFYELLTKIDETLSPLGVRYSLETKGMKKFTLGKAKDYEISEVMEEPLVASSGYFELYKDSAGEYRFRLKAPNHQIIAVSEGYSSKASCLNGIKSVMKNASVAEIEDLSME
jgi:uncharacterized protein YegP (UPF0339 family)